MEERPGHIENNDYGSLLAQGGEACAVITRRIGQFEKQTRLVLPGSQGHFIRFSIFRERLK